jgi:hypothetical protein
VRRVRSANDKDRKLRAGAFGGRAGGSVTLPIAHPSDPVASIVADKKFIGDALASEVDDRVLHTVFAYSSGARTSTTAPPSVVTACNEYPSGMLTSFSLTLITTRMSRSLVISVPLELGARLAAPGLDFVGNAAQPGDVRMLGALRRLEAVLTCPYGSLPRSLHAPAFSTLQV